MAIVGQRRPAVTVAIVIVPRAIWRFTGSFRISSARREGFALCGKARSESLNDSRCIRSASEHQHTDAELAIKVLKLRPNASSAMAVNCNTLHLRIAYLTHPGSTYAKNITSRPITQTKNTLCFSVNR